MNLYTGQCSGEVPTCRQGALDEVLSMGIKGHHTPERYCWIFWMLKFPSALPAVSSIAWGLRSFLLIRTSIALSSTHHLSMKLRFAPLYDGSFLSCGSNVLLVGGTGTGKTHLAIAIARNLIKHSRRGRYFNVVDLVNQLNYIRTRRKARRESFVA